MRTPFKIVLLIIFLLSVFGGALYFADYVKESEQAKALVDQFGYFGIFIISVVAGLNLFVPIPAPTFVPIFTAAGYPFLGIILIMVIGTTIADLIGYFIGLIGKNYAENKYPKMIFKASQNT